MTPTSDIEVVITNLNCLATDLAGYVAGKENNLVELYIDTIDTTMELLKKQIPQKPKETDWLYCPVCDYAFGLWGEVKNCPECLQAIDWSEE